MTEEDAKIKLLKKKYRKENIAPGKRVRIKLTELSIELATNESVPLFTGTVFLFLSLILPFVLWNK